MLNYVRPEDVANNLIDRSLNEGIEMTPLMLQKMLYFVYATYLRATGCCLFCETFETWSKGPVLSHLYAKFYSCPNAPIVDFIYPNSHEMNPRKIVEKDLVKRCIDTVWGKYKNLTEEELVYHACKNGSAWAKAVKDKRSYLLTSDILEDGTEIVWTYEPQKIKNKYIEKK